MANNSLPSRSKNETVSQIKRPKYEQKYKADYVREFKGITKSRTGDTYAFCTICRSDLNIAHGGRDDIKKHLGTKKHANAATAAAAQPSISPFVSPDRSLAVTRAELLFTSFLVEHNIGPCFSQHFTDNLVRKAKSATYQTLLDGSAEVQSPE